MCVRMCVSVNPDTPSAPRTQRTAQEASGACVNYLPAALAASGEMCHGHPVGHEGRFRKGGRPKGPDTLAEKKEPQHFRASVTLRHSQNTVSEKMCVRLKLNASRVQNKTQRSHVSHEGSSGDGDSMPNLFSPRPQGRLPPQALGRLFTEPFTDFLVS